MTTTPTTLAMPQPPVIDQRLPRHVQVRDELMRRIADRVWKAGEALPSEERLAAEFSISVGTMRKAIQALEQEKVVERIHGKGTFVTRAFERSSMLRFVRFRGTEQQELPAAHILTLETTAADDVMRGKLQLRSATEKVLYLHRSRAYGDEVVLVEHIWLPARRFAKLESYLKRESPPLLYPVYDEVCDVVVSRAVDELSMGILDADDAAIFGVDPATPCMRIERTMRDHGGQVVEWRVSFVPADRFYYSVEIR
ncbi:GntR family transcriptional regulator [Pigmentiphaga litoralis]|nr:GntR family transcriptional regulator [Pigmentiphaga litoralis]